MLHYFAYGNNMHPHVISERCMVGPSGAGTIKEVGIARLKDHRMAFTINAPHLDGHMADIIYEQNFYVYGYLYQLDDLALSLLDEAEYVSEKKFYFRDEITLELVSAENPYQKIETIQAITYRVKEENRLTEEPPHPEYALNLIAGAEIRQLPDHYIKSLRSMYLSGGEIATGKLLCLPTKNRGKNYKIPIIQLSPLIIEKLKLRRFAYVSFGDKTCLARVQRDDNLNIQGRVCRIDESIRRALGFPVLEPGIEFYGGFAKISPAPNRARPRQIIPARSVLLRMAKVDYLDCEKKLVVLHESLLSILGLEKGDYVQIFVTVFDAENDRYVHKKITRRAFTGSTTNRREGGQLRPYPEEGVIHLDLDAREELGLGGKYIEYYPLFVAASTKDLLLNRFVFYILVLVGILVGIQQSVAPVILSFFEIPKTLESLYGLVISFIGSLFLGAIVVWNDVARKVKP